MPVLSHLSEHCCFLALKQHPQSTKAHQPKQTKHSRNNLSSRRHPFVLFRVAFCFASFSGASLTMTHKKSSCILFLRAGSDPTSLCFVVLVLWFCVFFVCLLCLWFGFLWDRSLDCVQVHYLLCSFEAIDV